MGSLGALAALIPSQEDLAAFERELEAFDATVEALPSVTVQVINLTDVPARVTLVSGMAGPEPEGVFGSGGFDDNSLAEIDSQSVLIAPLGTASGSVKCGEVIGISVSAPVQGAGFFDDGNGGFGLFLEAGNVQLAGAGVSQETFTGDVMGARFIRVGDDGLDCAMNVLILEIESVATEPSRDPMTGEVLVEQTRGAGTLRIE